MTQATAIHSVPITAPVMLEPARHCLFLDFDGTLVEFADRPDAVVLPETVRDDVARIHRLLDGAVAVVSGREIAVLDHFLAPLKLPVAGVHGLMRRDGRGQVHTASFDASMLERLAGQLETFCATRDGLILERKPGSIALHYRTRPDMEGACRTAMDSAITVAAGTGGRFHIMQGKMVIEARASSATKATAISAFMDEAPFAGRVPVFAGDDVTDEDGFAEVNAHGGLTIKIGDGDTRANHRMADVASFRNWLASCLR